MKNLRFLVVGVAVALAVIVSLGVARAESPVGRTISFSDGTTATYAADGVYVWKKKDGSTGKGVWMQRSKYICIVISVKDARCDQYDFGRQTITNGRGKTYSYR